MPKKSKAQIKRLAKRAEARGEVYEAPPLAKEEQESSAPTTTPSSSSSAKLASARKLQHELLQIEKDETMKAKDRRSAKRKAEAIAFETTGCQAEDLLAWYKEQNVDDKQETKNKKAKDKSQAERKTIPYILFIGQLSYDTTKESLMEHFKTELLADDGFEINEQTCQIRLLTDAKTKKSRGMAFVELSTPELMHGCLKLHKTMLEGRRINVEKSAGGGKHSEQRKEKLKTFRTQQEEYIESMVVKMIDEYKQKGEIQDGELDEGVIGLCKRHSGAVVEAALERYVDSNGREMDNPSAYLSFLLGKLAHEGIYDSEKGKKAPNNSDSERPRKRAR